MKNLYQCFRFDFSGSNEKSPNSFSYNDSYDTSPVPSGSLSAVNGDYPLHGLSLDQQAAYLHGLGVHFSSGFQNVDRRWCFFNINSNACAPASSYFLSSLIHNQFRKYIFKNKNIYLSSIYQFFNKKYKQL